jgi:hypothetical protein
MTDSLEVVIRPETELVDVFLTDADPLRELLDAVFVPRDEALRLLRNTFPEDDKDVSSGLFCSATRA